jgi:dTDP-4-dehydrorhamnose reductase
MKILVTGFNGQLGFDIVSEGLNRGFIMQGIGRNQLDITKEEDVKIYIKKVNPDVIIHCAAYTAVDKAEDDKETCWDVNVNGTKYLVTAAKECNAVFMYISTDYVFDGMGDIPFVETDIPNPISYYGKTKYEGEKIVRKVLDDWYIVRISWVFGINGNNFIKTMLRLSEAHSELNVVGDQIGSPTYTLDLARLLIDMIQTKRFGVYHASNEGFCTWAELATEIFRITEKDVSVNSITTTQYPTRAVRPKNSRLSKQKLIENNFKSLPQWQDAVKRYLYEYTIEVK